MKTEIIKYIDSNSRNECEIFKVTTSDGHLFYERDYTSQTDSIETYFEDFLDYLKQQFKNLLS